MNDKKMSGNEIKKIRLSLGLTMKEFGKKFEPPASDSIVSRWERGVSLPSSRRMKVISEMNNSNGNYISNYIDQLEKKAKETSKENAKIADDFNFNEYDDVTNRLSIAIEQKKKITADNELIDKEDENKNAVFLLNLYRTLERSRLKAAHFDKETQSKLFNIISLLLSNARDIDIDDIHKRITESEPKDKKE